MKYLLKHRRIVLIILCGILMLCTSANAAAKVFVNSDGKITEFAFDSKTVYAGEERVVIFNENTDDGENEFEDENQIKDDSSVGIIGGADGPTAIFVSGNPIKAIIIPIIVFAVIIFAGGFAFGYIVKSKQLK